ncbi:MAG TPA: pitrilysin family protein [Thermoanaerobaculia bacterium]|nr:pitrilysin family protein [Thermoanaerobaculia bacterium]
MLFLLVTSAALAQQQVTPPPPGPPRQATIPQPVEKTLENGLRIIVVPKHNVPLVSARVLVKAGSEEDPGDLAGLAQMTASLITKGTKTRSAEQIARGMEALGATLNTSAGWDASQVNVTVMSPSFGKAMEIVGDVVRNPSFRKDEIELVRRQSVDALEVVLQEPDSLADLVAARVVFGEAAYGHNVGGTPETLGAIAREMIAAFHRAYYRPENSVLVVAGDVEPADVFSTAEKTFGTWEKTPGVMGSVGKKPEERSSPPRVVVVDMPDAGQAAVVVTRRGLRRTDPLYYPALVANSVLGGGYSARLNQEIRIKRGLSYGAYSSFDVRGEAGPFFASTQTKNESAAEVAGLIVDELNRLSRAELPETELTPRKAVLIGGFGRSLETSAGIVGRVSALALHGLPLEDINRYIGSVQAVDAATVREFAKTHMGGGSASIVIVGDARQFVEKLRERFGSVEVIPAAELDLNIAALRKMKEAA